MKKYVCSMPFLIPIALGFAILSAQGATEPSKSIPKPKELLQMAQQALGGSDYFRPRPYSVDVLFSSIDPYDGSKSVNRKDTYKEGKYHQDATVLIKRIGKPIQSYLITHTDKRESWLFRLGFSKTWEKEKRIALPPIPIISARIWDSLAFVPETSAVTLIKQNNTEYYKLTGKINIPEWEGHGWICTLLIDTKTYLVYKEERINPLGKYKRTDTYMNYYKVGNIMIPQKHSLSVTDNNGAVIMGETTYSNFVFRNDIPDSLFEMFEVVQPGKKKAVTYQFFKSKAHPKWQSPDAGLVNRLKDRVVDIVNNYPDRHEENLEILNRLADNIENIFEAAGGRVSKQEVKWKDRSYYNVLASFGPENGLRIVVGAHYDAVKGTPGANDNASALAVLFELAQTFGKMPPNIRVDLAAYSLEEVGLVGSQAHVEALKAENAEIRAMIALECVGYFTDKSKSQRFPPGVNSRFYPSKGNFIAVVSDSNYDSLVETIKTEMTKATPLPVVSLVAPVEYSDAINRSDHRAFLKKGYPGIMITDSADFRMDAYHEPDDVPERLDYRRMAMVFVGVEQAIRALSTK